MPTSEVTLPQMTEGQQEEFLKKRVDALEKIMPLSDEDFDEELDELKWKWSRYLLPFSDKTRAQQAAYKKRIIQRQPEFFKQIRLFKPLAMKHPALMKRLITQDITDTEEIKYKLFPEWIANEEKIAGFTYEDLALETDGGKFSAWQLPKAGEMVTGVVVDFSEKGAFLDIGAKSWAYMPLDQCSLVPISNAAEVFELGQEVDCKVLCQGSFSRTGGDEWATQFVVSATAIQSTAAWEKIDKIMTGEADESLVSVTVMAMKSFGAVVMTSDGLEALIPNSQLADRVGDTSMVGTEIKTQIFRLRKDLISDSPAMRPGEYSLLLSYKNVATMELFEQVEEGQVLDAVVKQPRELSLDVTVKTEDGQPITCSIRKVDISSKTAFGTADIFEVGEEIKVYVISKLKESGEIRLSTRALERKKGEILEDKAGVFARAEETAKKYTQRASKEKEKFAAMVEGVLSDVGFDAPQEKKETGTVDLDDDDEDEGLGF